MSTSTSVVSTMYPSLKLFPGGNDGQGWMYLTAPVPSGKAVELVDLFTSRSRGLKAIAAYVEQHLLVTMDSCARNSHGGFDPTVENYRNFALTVGGLDIGLGQGQIGDEACGAIRVTVPWSARRARAAHAGSRGHPVVWCCVCVVSRRGPRRSTRSRSEARARRCQACHPRTTTELLRRPARAGRFRRRVEVAGRDQGGHDPPPAADQCPCGDPTGSVSPEEPEPPGCVAGQDVGPSVAGDVTHSSPCFGVRYTHAVF
jgi:hypothetical protein